MLELRGGERGRQTVRKTVVVWWCVCATTARAQWLPCLGDMQWTYVVLEPQGWHWRWGKTLLQGKCFPWSEAATDCTAASIDTSPVDRQTSRFTHKCKGRLIKCSLPTENPRTVNGNRTHASPHLKTGSFHQISLEEMHNHTCYSTLTCGCACSCNSTQLSRACEAREH